MSKVAVWRQVELIYNQGLMQKLLMIWRKNSRKNSKFKGNKQVLKKRSHHLSLERAFGGSLRLVNSKTFNLREEVDNLRSCWNMKKITGSAWKKLRLKCNVLRNIELWEILLSHLTMMMDFQIYLMTSTLLGRNQMLWLIQIRRIKLLKTLLE